MNDAGFAHVHSAGSDIAARLGPYARSLYRYWQSIHPAPGVLPGRQHFDPVVLGGAHPYLLPNLWMVDVERDPLRFRLRLAGDIIQNATHQARLGRYVDEADDNRVGGISLHALLARVVESRAPNAERGPPRVRSSRYVRDMECLSLPFATAGTDVDLILSITIYAWEPGHRLRTSPFRRP